MKTLRACVAVLASLLAGCTTIEPARLPDTLAATLRGQEVGIVIQGPSTFGVMRERDVPLGPVGIPLMAAQGEHLRKAANIGDPAGDIATTLADLLAGRHGASILPARGATPHDEPEAIVAAAPAGSRYVLTVATVSWGLGRVPVRGAAYSVTYVARARLIDARTQAVIAEGGCLQAPDGSEHESTAYADFTDQNAMLIKTELAARVDRCIHFIRRDMLGL
ncbi:hypothetical protein [Scleromatobacter humisilvae]|uniref:Lipoprotein n=1 Tax=Scleromatobacter humisilvae TaxID=2897159 RepID=A0A9X2C1E3_9BURK|nr:hypothetical protein [Scleromatobacter humisilvae]MCK9688202.1 hypothetical protein [Scleromatobacter humisilvae]